MAAFVKSGGLKAIHHVRMFRSENTASTYFA
jgi:hypothetical protein